MARQVSASFSFLCIVALLLLLLDSRESHAQWTTASLSHARYLTASASCGDLALFAGGYANGALSSVVDVFNATSDTWSTGSLSQARDNLAAASAQGRVFFAGGWTGSVYSAVVDIYDTASGDWTLASLSQPRAALAAAAVDDLILFGGGKNGATYSSVVDIYNASSGNWTVGALSQPRFVLTAVSHGNLVFFAGGFNGDSSASAAVDIYDATSGVWSLASLSQARGYLAAVSVGSLVIFAGGYTGSSYSAVVDIYDTASGVWSVASLSRNRYYLAAAAVGDLALFAGGYGDSGLAAVVDIYSASTGRWDTALLSRARSVLSGTAVGNLVLFGGGYDNLGPAGYDTVDIFDASLYALPSPLPSPILATYPVPLAPVMAAFNLTAPSVALSQSGQTAQWVDLGLVSLEEISMVDGGAVLQSIDLAHAGWEVGSDNGSIVGAATTYTFVCHLGATTNNSNNATLGYSFATFGSAMPITTETNYSFTATPAWLKFSLNITDWRWNTTLRLTLRIDPPFARADRWDDAPQVGMTTFLLGSGDVARVSTVVRLLNFGENVRGGNGNSTYASRVETTATASVDGSSLSLTFEHFNDTLLFDPDFGLLLVDRNSGGGGGDNLGLIIGVAVAVPVAVVFVVTFVSVTVCVIAIRRRIALAETRGAVGFDDSCGADERL